MPAFLYASRNIPTHRALSRVGMRTLNLGMSRPVELRRILVARVKIVENRFLQPRLVAGKSIKAVVVAREVGVGIEVVVSQKLPARCVASIALPPVPKMSDC